MLILHYASLMMACALIDIRRDDELDVPLTFNHEDPYLFRCHIDPEVIRKEEEERIREEEEIMKNIRTSCNNGGGLPGLGGGGNGSGSSGGGGSPAHGRASGRANTVPLQMLITSRRSLQERYGYQAINSFEPVDAKEKDLRAPSSYASTSADAQRFSDSPSSDSLGEGAASASPVRRRGGLCGQAGGQSIDTDASSERSKSSNSTKRKNDQKLRRGSMTQTEYLQAAVMMKASGRAKIRLARANCFDVIGGVTEGELQLLEPLGPGDRAYVVQTWMVRLMTNRLAAGGLAIPPPLLSRTYQVLSDGTAAAMQARKVSYVAFPFPLRQLLLWLLLVFNLMAPITIASFMKSEFFVAVLSFFVCLGTRAGSSSTHARTPLAHLFRPPPFTLQATPHSTRRRWSWSIPLV